MCTILISGNPQEMQGHCMDWMSQPTNSQPTVSASSSAVSPRKQALVREKRPWQNKYYRQKKKAAKISQGQKPRRKISEKRKKQKLISELTEYVSGPAIDFVASRVYLRKKMRMRWSEKDKCVALCLYHTSPKAHRWLKKIFALPGIATLRREMRKVKVYPGFNENILTSLNEKLAVMPEGSNICALRCDEMAIKEQVQYIIER